MQFARTPVCLSLLLAAALATSGCLPDTPATAPAAYVRAQPAPDPPPPAPKVVEAAPPTNIPGQLKRVPVPGAPAAPAKSEPPTARGKAAAAAPPKPQQTVQNANQSSSQRPDAFDYFNAILQYNYEPGSLYQVYAAPMRVTDIALEPGERIVGQPASGDVVRWILAVGKSVSGGQEQQHIYVKPTRPDLETNLAINTDRRTYMLELHSFADTYMAAVQWRYPQDEMAKLAQDAAKTAEAARDAAPVVGLDHLNFNYSIEVEKGEPAWTPVQAFDDGRRTFIRFPQAMLVREAPALFVLRNKETQLVNYRVKNDFYVVDRLIDAAELRVGQSDQEIVRITRTNPAAAR